MGKYSYDHIRRLLKDGYPYRIVGNGGYEAVLVGIQPLVHDYCAVYRYPGGDAIHALWEIQRYFSVVEQYPSDWDEYLRLNEGGEVE